MSLVELFRPTIPGLYTVGETDVATAIASHGYAVGGRRGELWRELPADGIAWVQSQFPRYFQSTRGDQIPLAARHIEFWQWIFALRPGSSVPAFFAVWGRGGGKSTNTELGCNTIGYYGLRKYGWYISGTQEQADDHVGNVAAGFEHLGVERALSKYGQSRGWRRNRIRTADGFILDAVGLDTAARGVKLDEDRPDLMIFDDIDDTDDSDVVIERKEKALTRKLLPAGTNDVAVIGVQNIPNEDGIFARILNGKADYLLDRTVSGPYPALEGFEANDDGEAYERRERDDGSSHYVILRGTPTWEGQNLDDCTTLLNRIGPRAFLIECQHETGLLSSTLFPRDKWRYFDVWPDPDWFDVLIQSWDFRTSEQERNEVFRNRSYVAGQLWGRKGGVADGQVFLLARYFAQVGFKDSCDALCEMSEEWPGAYAKLIEAKANGPAVYSAVKSKVFGVQLMQVGGAEGGKYARASAVSLIQNEGRAWLPSPRLAPWVTEYVDNMYNFPSRPDDDTDATSQAWRHFLRFVPAKDTVREKQEHLRKLMESRMLAMRRNGRNGSRVRV